VADTESVARALVTERFNALVGYARVIAGTEVDAEAMVREALVDTLANPRLLTQADVAELHCRRAIVRHVAATARAAASDLSPHDAAKALIADADPDAAFRPGAEVESEPASPPDDLLAALDRLKPLERLCVALRHLENLSVAQTAHVLGISEASVRGHVGAGVGTINALLGTQESPDEDAFVQVVGRGAR